MSPDERPDDAGKLTELAPEKAWRAVFLENLAKTANISASAVAARVTRQWVYACRSSDAAFAAAWDDALEVATDTLEAESRRRALEGCEEPVFYQGVECGRIRKYSDTLAIFLLKAHRPDKFRESVQHEHAGNPDKPLKIVIEYVNENGAGETEGWGDPAEAADLPSGPADGDQGTPKI